VTLSIVRVDDGPHEILRLTGPVDLATRQTLMAAGLRTLHDGGVLTLDLAEVDFMDASGIGALVRLANASTALGRPFVVAERSAGVLRALRAAGMAGAWAAGA
jgi:anti-anti-sigma factor